MSWDPNGMPRTGPLFSPLGAGWTGKLTPPTLRPLGTVRTTPSRTMRLRQRRTQQVAALLALLAAGGVGMYFAWPVMAPLITPYLPAPRTEPVAADAPTSSVSPGAAESPTDPVHESAPQAAPQPAPQAASEQGIDAAADRDTDQTAARVALPRPPSSPVAATVPSQTDTVAVTPAGAEPLTNLLAQQAQSDGVVLPLALSPAPPSSEDQEDTTPAGDNAAPQSAGTNAAGTDAAARGTSGSGIAALPTDPILPLSPGGASDGDTREIARNAARAILSEQPADPVPPPTPTPAPPSVGTPIASALPMPDPASSPGAGLATDPDPVPETTVSERLSAARAAAPEPTAPKPTAPTTKPVSDTPSPRTAPAPAAKPAQPAVVALAAPSLPETVATPPAATPPAATPPAATPAVATPPVTPRSAIPPVSAPGRKPAPPARADRTATLIGEIQTLLRALNIEPGRVDGTLTRQTVQAIQTYQDFAGLPVTGKPDEALLEDLRNVTGLLAPNAQ